MSGIEREKRRGGGRGAEWPRQWCTRTEERKSDGDEEGKREIDRCSLFDFCDLHQVTMHRACIHLMAGGTKNEREIKKPLNGDEANRCRARRLPGKRRIDEIADNRKDR